MSKRTKWKMIMATDTFKMLSGEEKAKYWEEKKKRERDMYKFTLALEKMPVHKPKFSGKTKENEDDSSELV